MVTDSIVDDNNDISNIIKIITAMRRMRLRMIRIRMRMITTV